MSNTGSVDRVNVCAAFSRAFHFSPRLYLICKDSGTKEENEESFVRKPPARRLTRATTNLHHRIPRLRILDRQKRESVKWPDSNLTGTYRSPLLDSPRRSRLIDDAFRRRGYFDHFPPNRITGGLICLLCEGKILHEFSYRSYIFIR